MTTRRTICIAVTMSVLSMTANLFAADVKPAPLALPFAESFASAKLDSAWAAHVAKGNALEVKDGALEIRARVDSRAHIERALGADPIRVSCAIRPAAGVGVSAAVCWNDENACQIGVYANNIRVREILGTYGYDYELGAWPAGQWRTVAIEVAKDCVRYLASEDGRDFKVLRVSRRPERFAKVPALLLIGEGPETKLFPRPSPFIDPPASEVSGTSQVRDVRVTALDPKQAQASAEERATLEADERDTLGEQEMASADDPTFESVARHFPPFKWPREAIGIKDGPDAIGVAHDGGLQFTGNSAKHNEPTGFFEIGEPAYRFGTGSEPCRRSLHKGYMPVVTLRDRHDGLELEQTAFGYAKEFSPDEPLVAYVRFKVTNTSESARKVTLRWRVQPAPDKSPALSWQLDVPARGERQVDLRAPYTIAKTPATEAAAGKFDSKLAEVAAYWDKLLAPGSRFEVPEQRVQDAFRAWLAYNFINVHKRGDVYHVCDGSGFYAECYGASVALYCNNMDLLGYHDLAERNLDSLLTFMQPSGLLAVNFGDTDTGVTLWSMSEHYRITRDEQWLRRVAPKMIKMCGWIIAERKKALERATSEPAVTKGFIRYKPYADLLHPAADYFSNGYLCTGLAATADVFAQIGMTEEAARLKKESDEYRKDIAVSMDAAVFTDAGMQILPAMPDTRELWKESNGSANGYYGLVAPFMFEAGIPAWNDPEADLLINALRKRGGLTLGVPRFHDLIDHAYAYGYWMTCLDRDEVKPAILGLYASMAFGMTRDTYSAVECTAIRTGENYWTLPHTYSNTQQMRLLRNMLVREHGDTLRLAHATPRPWLAQGKRIAVKDAPTLFGRTSFSIESNVDAGLIKVHIDPPPRATPAGINIRLRHPARLDIKAAESSPKTDLSVKGDVIELRGLSKPVDLLVHY